MLSPVSQGSMKKSASLWTAQAVAPDLALPQAAVDVSVSAESLRAAVKDAQVRAAAFARPVTEDLLRKSV